MNQFIDTIDKATLEIEKLDKLVKKSSMYTRMIRGQ